jgi:hypothetical protein
MIDVRSVPSVVRRVKAHARRDMRTFWNDRAKEDAFYFVDTRQRYRAPDPGRFARCLRRDVAAGS